MQNVHAHLELAEAVPGYVEDSYRRIKSIAAGNGDETCEASVAAQEGRIYAVRPRNEKRRPQSATVVARPLNGEASAA